LDIVKIREAMGYVRQGLFLRGRYAPREKTSPTSEEDGRAGAG